MIGFVLYSVTAAVVLFCYGFLHFIGTLASGRPPIASFASFAVPGACLLFLAGLLNLWKPRIAGFFALAGALLIWSVLLSPMQLAAFFYFLAFLAIGYVFPVMIVAILVGFSTIYAGIAVIGSDSFAVLPAWLVPQSSFDRTAGEGHSQPPSTVRCATILLYFWLALVIGVVIQEYWRTGHLDEAGALGASIWILDFTIISAMLWVIVQISKGRNWARITFLAMFLLSLRETITTLVQRHEPKLVISLVTIALAVFAAAMFLLFSAASRPYFRTKQP